MSRPTLVRVETRESFVDMAGVAWATYPEAYRSSIRSLLAAELVDQYGGPNGDAAAAALLEQFVIVPRDRQP